MSSPPSEPPTAGERHFSREEANALLPQLIERLSRLRDSYAAVAGHQALVQSVQKHNGGDTRSTDWLGASRDVDEQIHWLDEQGIIVRDVEQGLIDFPSEHEGRPIFLCWKLGEPSVDYWHDLETGFAGRQPLD